jgi:fluoride ion exporter CrcB/FEX
MDASFNQGLYYKHSGRFSAVGALIALLIGLIAGVICGWLYAWLIHWNPFVYINAVGAFGFGAITGLATEQSLESHRCRNVPITGFVALLAALVSYYISWAVWLHALNHASTFAFLLDPAGMWMTILKVNEAGAWTLHGSVVKGFSLWVAWGVEAACILGFAVYTAVHSMQEAAYCEGCDRFAKAREGVCFVAAGKAPPMEEKAAFKIYRKALKQHAAELKQHLESKDLPYLEQLGAVQPDAIAWYQLDLVSCPKCNMTNSLRVVQVRRKIEGKKIKNDTEQSQVFRQLLLSSTESDNIKKLGEKLPPLVPKLLERLSKSQKAAAGGK